MTVAATGLCKGLTWLWVLGIGANYIGTKTYKNTSIYCTILYNMILQYEVLQYTILYYNIQKNTEITIQYYHI